MLPTAERARGESPGRFIKPEADQQHFRLPALRLMQRVWQIIEYGIKQRTAMQLGWQLLFNPGHHAVVSDRHCAAAGRNSTTDDFQQSTFTATVMANQADTVTFFQGEGDLGQQRAEGVIKTKGLCRK